ncbi:MAG: gliding motility-associated ABC transporter substrate-binding protein GldG [Luteibaculaceae bacterium]
MSKGNKWKDISEFLAISVTIVTVLILSGYFFFRIDLTSEKRHTLKPETKELLRELPDQVFFRVYLKGDYPADFKRLEKAVREKLDEMRAYAGVNIEYEFVNPSASEDPKKNEEVYIQLTEEGLKFTNIQVRTKDGISEKIIFPGATLFYGERKLSLQLLKSQERLPDAEMINASINNLEYEIATALRLITSTERPRLAVLTGHGELDNMQMADFERALRTQYAVERKKLTDNINLLSQISDTNSIRVNMFDGIILAKPTKTFTEKEKFVIDQFIMRGGKAIFLIDPINASLDSLRIKPEVIAVPYNHNLSDMFFKYGFKLENNLLLDANCAPIPLNVGQMGDKPQYKIFPWYFFPTVLHRDNNPISANIDPVLTQFVSSIDTLEHDPNIRKTILLETSQYTRIFRSPVRINPSIVTIDPKFPNSNTPHQPVAAVYEGRFTSIFENRLPKDLTSSNLIQFKEKSIKPTRMLIVADGDVARNPVDTIQNMYFPLGFDRNMGRTVYGNLDFLMNAVNYVMGDNDFISTRSRAVRVRKLDPEKIKFNSNFYQTLNVGLPVALIVIFGLSLNLYRNRKYKSNKQP